MEFIGRKAELAKLSTEYEHDGSFVVIYGRRRVGKTTLIKEFLKNKTAFYFLATEELETQSMKRLAGVIFKVLGVKSPPNGDLFEGLSEEQGSRIIETLKRYVRSAERKCKNGY